MDSMDENSAVEDSVILEDPFQNMKVAELKKELKARGLPVSGTKQELLDRLQNAHAKETELSSTINEDEILNDGPLDLPTDVPEVSNDTSVKECVAAPSESAVPEKKISLNRTSKIIVPPPQPTVSTLETNEASQDPAKTNDEAKRNVSAVKGMSAQERLAMRAQRFNVASDSDTTLKSVSNSNSLKAVSKYKMVKTPTEAPDLDVLKKRAERFGENVSSIMKQIEAKEKVLKRKMRFGVSSSAMSTISSDESERKKLRAQRFSLL